MQVSEALKELLETVHYIGEDWPDLDTPPEGWLDDGADEEDDDEED